MAEQAEQTIQQHLWWVIPGKLAGVRKPTGAEIAELKAAGVGAIVSVMDDPSNLDLYEQAGLSYDKATHTILTANPEVELRDAQITFLRKLAGESAIDSI